MLCRRTQWVGANGGLGARFDAGCNAGAGRCPTPWAGLCASPGSAAAGGVSHRSLDSPHGSFILFFFFREKKQRDVVRAPKVHGGCLLQAVKSLLLSCNPFTEERQVKRFLTDKLKTK